ncbi:MULTISPECIES: TRAP transporter large permease subunit [unclassified Herbaspirillum]|uniref:TRAP transporter large permease n=1 Tax=unclassified Herbaspirillum TaxID=2624150 RepID=UPI000E2F31F2|nr:MULTISPECIES: TRAP transporter large permease subunit [unclassified Herbaspirillum]RFB70854.1 ABC transporter permease [Herbaspirillum sp. 3R-3a1]TFI08622.1 TRAP transporter large permease subunit [Herbaspirillum sp. 3R11]TFI15037.1 TRAP transporter large permease subunit [Herbaspirillum sp. 3R-11]TFI29774.1 TRAP transporter large permease subunit [Herbaspirillum sp. 3C11]
MEAAITYREPVRMNPTARALVALNRLVMHGVGALAALLVVAETVVLLTGVIYRYGLHDPLVWSDELASILFIWLSMLGAVLALDRGEHMRLTAIVNKCSEKGRIWLETVAALVVCIFVLMVIHPAVDHSLEQMAITTPALEIPDGLRAAALPVGAILMLLAAVSRMAAMSSFRLLLSALAVMVIVGGGLWLCKPALLAMGNYNLIVFFVVLIGLCVAGGIPIAFAFGTATMAYLSLATSAPLMIVVSRMDEGMSSLILLSVPLFVLLGSLLEMSGLAKTLIDFMASLLGHVRGGLQYVLLGAMFLVSGISGSKAADMAAIAPALFPEMKRRGSKPEELVALLSSSGAMTETIPPSLVLITIGAVCSVSITALFIGGLMPATFATFAIAIICWLRARREPIPEVKRAPMTLIMKTMIAAIPALALPMLIRVAVIEGVATATEVATIGVAYTIVVGLIMHLFMKHLDFKRLYPMLIEAAALSGAILLIIGMATSMAWALTQSGFSAKLVSLMQGVPGGGMGFLLITIVIFIVLGSLLEGIPAIVLFGPLLFPVARSLGIHDVHYAMVVILAMGIGLFAPPFGVGFYAACAIGKVSPDGVFNLVWGYLAALVVALLVVAFVPWISIGFL